MDWCSVYLTPQGLPKYIYLSTTYNGIRTKNRPVWFTPGAAHIRWMGPIHNPRWEQKRTEGYVIVSRILLVHYAAKTILIANGGLLGVKNLNDVITKNIKNSLKINNRPYN